MKDEGGGWGSFCNKFFINSIIIFLWFLFLLLIVPLLNTSDKRGSDSVKTAGSR